MTSNRDLKKRMLLICLIMLFPLFSAKNAHAYSFELLGVTILAPLFAFLTNGLKFLLFKPQKKPFSSSSGLFFLITLFEAVLLWISAWATVVWRTTEENYLLAAVIAVAWALIFATIAALPNLLLVKEWQIASNSYIQKIKKAIFLGLITPIVLILLCILRIVLAA